MAEPRADWTLQQAREWLTTRLSEGAQCPCCQQHAQQYARSVTKSMVHTMGHLLGAQRQDTKRYVHLAKIPQRTRDVATCGYFGLIDEDPHRRGWWRVTDFGADWLEGGERIPKYAHVYNGEVVGFTGDRVRVFDVDVKFELDKVLRHERLRHE